MAKPIKITIVIMGTLLAVTLWFVLAGLTEPSVDPDFEADLTAAAPADVEGVIAQQAEKLGITALSVAVIDGEENIQNFHIGRARENGLMQAASLSKAAAAATILLVADQQGVTLDDDIRPQITSLDISAIEGGNRPVTLRQLLSHTTGASQSGYPGYPRSDALPSTADVIRNPPQMIESQLEFSGEPGEFRYSGGGYTIAQLWAEDVTGKSFDVIADEVLLGPLGMADSTFAQPIESAAIAPSSIVGADAPFTLTEGIFSSLDDSWHNYPEKAAAGLWSTPQDYALFVTALLDAAEGADNTSSTVIPTAIAQQMVAPQAETKWEPGSYYGLGVMVTMNDADERLSLSHTGANAGYRSFFNAREASPESGRRVVVVFANTATAANLNKAIGAALMAR